MGRSPRDALYGAASRGNEVQSEDMSDTFSLSLSVLHYHLFFRSLKHTLCSLRSSTACQGLCASPGELSAHTQVDCFVSVCVCERKALVMDLKFVHYTSHTSRTTHWYLFFHESTPLECPNYILGTVELALVLLKVLEAVSLLNSCCCQSWAVFGTTELWGGSGSPCTPSSFRLR